MAVKEYIDDTYNRAMFTDRPAQPQTMDQGPTDDTGIMEGFAQTDEQQQGMIDQAQDLNGLVAAARGADIPEPELRNELLHAMIPSMGEDKATAVAALVSPQILTLAQPIVQAMYDDEGVMGLADVEQAAQAQIPMAQGMPQMDPNQMAQMASAQQVPGMKEGGIVSLAKGGLTDIKDVFAKPKIPGMTETMEEYLPAYQDIYGEGMDPDTNKGLAKLQIAQMFLGWADPTKGTSFGERAVKSAQETIPNITALAMQKAKEESEATQKSKIGAMEATREDIKEAKKEIRDIENEERRMKVKRGEYFDVETNSVRNVSEYDAATQPERFTIPPEHMDSYTGQWTEMVDNKPVTFTSDVHSYQYPDGPRYLVPTRPGEELALDENTYDVRPPSGWRFLPEGIHIRTVKGTSAKDMFVSPEKRAEQSQTILNVKGFIKIAKTTRDTYVEDPTRAGVVGKARTLLQEGTQMTREIFGAVGKDAGIDIGSSKEWQEKLKLPKNVRSEDVKDNLFNRMPGETMQEKIAWAKENYFTKDKTEAETGFKTYDPDGKLANQFEKVVLEVKDAVSVASIDELNNIKELKPFFTSGQKEIMATFDAGFKVAPALDPRSPWYVKEIADKWIAAKEAGDQKLMDEASRESTLIARRIFDPNYKESTQLWGKGYDRELAKNRVRINTIVYGLARARKDSGRLNLDDIKRAAEALDVVWISGAGAVASLDEAITEMQAFEDRLKQNYNETTGGDFDRDYGYTKTDPLEETPDQDAPTVEELIKKKTGM